MRIVTARDATRRERRGEEIEEMPAEVDFWRGVRGRFAGRTKHEVIVMEIDADVVRAFRSP